MQNNVERFITENWDSCIRYNVKGDDSLIGMPYPYIVPSPSGVFQEMYYWDTFFTNKGLIIDGRIEQAKYNIDNMLYLIKCYGFMPNGNRKVFLNRSQPPYLSMMIRDVYEISNDKEWLNGVIPVLKTEYEFWMTKRITPIGLNQFRCDISATENLQDYNCERIGITPEGRTQEDIAECILCDCESGWDFNPRTEMHQIDFIYVDLNCNLYLYEKNFAYFSGILGNGEQEEWEEKAQKRCELMNKYLWNGQCFTDYNFKTKSFSRVFSAASFYPLWAGIATQEQAEKTVALLDKLEYNYGISVCEQNSVEGNYQWNYPNGWAPLHYITVRALERYGYMESARRIASKYVYMVEINFEKTGKLWEKYNVVTGDLNVSNEYEMPVMLGWTAGVYLFMKKFLE